MINLAGLNKVTLNADKTQATIGGGSTVRDTIDNAYAAGALVLTGNCNCVGALGAVLGGGYGNLMGEHGFGVDNVLSLRVVTADGQLRNVTAVSGRDLFWALRGAGPNFGIVTSATIKSYPASEEDMQAWMGNLVYGEHQLEAVVQAIQDLVLAPDMVVFLYFLADPTTGTPSVIVAPFLHRGNATTGRAAFASLYAIGPVADTTSVRPYNKWNYASATLCTRGSFKPGWGAGFQNMVPATWRGIWDAYVAFQKLPGAENSGVLLEAYSLAKARSVAPDSSAFPNRNVNFNAFAIPWYNDSSLDAQPATFGIATRDLLRSTSGLPHNQTYVLFKPLTFGGDGGFLSTLVSVADFELVISISGMVTRIPKWCTATVYLGCCLSKSNMILRTYSINGLIFNKICRGTNSPTRLITTLISE